MRKFLKIVRNIFLVLLSCIILFMSGVFIYHRIMLKQEDKYWENTPGQMVEVDGHKMHIYSAGSGDHTIVLLSAWGDSSPYANFLPIAKELSKDARVVILERFGYGFSDTVEGERTFDKILEEDREGLEKAGIEGPFIFVPHSISGVEVALWAQKYPSEVEGIVGLDIAVPSMREVYLTEGLADMSQIPMVRFMRDSGLLRLFYRNPENELEKIKYIIGYRNEANKNKTSESDHLVEALDEIVSKPLPTVPTVQVISKDTSDGYPDWEPGHQAFVDASERGKLIKLNCGHYVYLEDQEEVVEIIREFLNSL